MKKIADVLRLLSFGASSAPRSALLIMISLVLLLMTTACGKKGPVRPLLEMPPAAPEEVTLQQRGNHFVLGWTIPYATQNGVGDGDLAGFRIKRLKYDPLNGCPTCRDPQEVVAELDLKSPAPGQRIGRRLYWLDLDIRNDSGYSYAIIPLTVGGSEGFAAKLHLDAQQPPPSPTALQVTAGDSQVALQWLPPVLPAGMELVGYNLYRRQAERLFTIIPVNVEPLKTTQLLDRGLDNGRAYEYRVSTLVRSGDQLLESMATPGAQATPQ